MKKRMPPLVEIDSREVKSIEDIAYGMHYRVKGGLQVESNLSELVEEMELNNYNNLPRSTRAQKKTEKNFSFSLRSLRSPR